MRLLDGVDQRVDYATPFRLYDVRVGRWIQCDPLFDASRSTYQAFGLNPLQRIDPWGLDDLSYQYATDFVGPRSRPQGGDTRVAETLSGSMITLTADQQGHWVYPEVTVYGAGGNEQHWTTSLMAAEFDRINYTGTPLDLIYAPVNLASDLANFVPRTGNMILGSIREIDEKGLGTALGDAWSSFTDRVSSTRESVSSYFATASPAQVGSDLFFTIGSGEGVEFQLGLALSGGLGGISKASKVAQTAKVSGLPEYLYHYTDDASAASIEFAEVLGRRGKLTYLTPDGWLSPLQAQIDLALPQRNTATALFRVPTAGLDPSRVVFQRRVTGNVFNRAGGGWEVGYDGLIPFEYIEKVK